MHAGCYLSSAPSITPLVPTLTRNRPLSFPGHSSRRLGFGSRKSRRGGARTAQRSTDSCSPRRNIPSALFHMSRRVTVIDMLHERPRLATRSAGEADPCPRHVISSDSTVGSLSCTNPDAATKPMQVIAPQGPAGNILPGGRRGVDRVVRNLTHPNRLEQHREALAPNSPRTTSSHQGCIATTGARYSYCRWEAGNRATAPHHHTTPKTPFSSDLMLARRATMRRRWRWRSTARQVVDA
jgi:hypothetical protein